MSLQLLAPQPESPPAWCLVCNRCSARLDGYGSARADKRAVVIAAEGVGWQVGAFGSDEDRCPACAAGATP